MNTDIKETEGIIKDFTKRHIIMIIIITILKKVVEKKLRGGSFLLFD